MLSRKVQKSIRRIRLFLCIVLPLAVLSGVLQRSLTLHNLLDARLYFVIFIFLIILSLPWQVRRAARKQFLLVRDSFTSFRLQIDDSGYTGESPGIASGHMEWPAFTSWHEGKVIVLARNNTMYPLPKRALSDAQLEELPMQSKDQHRLEIVPPHTHTPQRYNQLRRWPLTKS